MPYITKDRRDLIDQNIANLSAALRGANCGTLGNVFTTLLVKVFDLDITPKYQRYNDVVGLLENVQHELIRRFQDPYTIYSYAVGADIVPTGPEVGTLIGSLKNLPKGPVAGDLNYTLCKILIAVFNIRGKQGDVSTNVRGVIEQVKKNIWLTQDPYEDQKITENGDIV